MNTRKAVVIAKACSLFGAAGGGAFGIQQFEHTHVDLKGGVVCGHNIFYGF